MTSFKVESKRIDNTVLVSLQGEINLNHAEELRQHLMNHMATDLRIILDFQKVMYIDSAGIGVLVTFLSHLKKHGGKLSLCHLNRTVKHMFDLTKISSFFEIHATIELALESFTKEK